MKKTSAAALLLSAVIGASALVSCGDKGSAPMGFEEMSDECLTYHLYVPDEWTTTISRPALHRRTTTEPTPSSVSMTAFELDRDVTSVDDYWALYEGGFQIPSSRISEYRR